MGIAGQQNCLSARMQKYISLFCATALFTALQNTFKYEAIAPIRIINQQRKNMRYDLSTLFIYQFTEKNRSAT